MQYPGGFGFQRTCLNPRGDQPESYFLSFFFLPFSHFFSPQVCICTLEVWYCGDYLHVGEPRICKRTRRRPMANATHQSQASGSPASPSRRHALIAFPSNGSMADRTLFRASISPAIPNGQPLYLVLGLAQNGLPTIGRVFRFLSSCLIDTDRLYDSVIYATRLSLSHLCATCPSSLPLIFIRRVSLSLSFNSYDFDEMDGWIKEL